MSRAPSARSWLWASWGLAVAGLVGGVVWRLVAPRAQIRIQSDGGFYVDPSPRQYLEADAWYAAIVVVVALATGVLVWRRLKDRPVAAVVSLAAGGLMAALLVWLVGRQLGQLDRTAALRAKIGTIISDRLDLGAKGLLGLLPIAAVATWLVLDLAAHRHRRRHQADAETADVPDPVYAPDVPRPPAAPAVPSPPAVPDVPHAPAPPDGAG